FEESIEPASKSRRSRRPGTQLRTTTRPPNRGGRHCGFSQFSTSFSLSCCYSTFQTKPDCQRLSPAPPEVEAFRRVGSDFAPCPPAAATWRVFRSGAGQ